MRGCLKRISTAGLILAIMAPQARADFQVRSATAMPAAVPPPTAAVVRSEPLFRPRANLVKSKFAIAIGFGTDVPVMFAVRQIVPAGIAVRYGSRLDEEALVSWAGGRPRPRP